jgi:hypothetical protein
MEAIVEGRYSWREFVARGKKRYSQVKSGGLGEYLKYAEERQSARRRAASLGARRDRPQYTAEVLELAVLLYSFTRIEFY